ncbi:MAG: class II glutamine amidotransferase [Lentisphaerae bacterium]|nr:class II glutamine amidotransferase [Lentisphaerota bacterium]
MCELLGFSSRRRRNATPLLREFFSHAERHPHGWGLARFENASAPQIEKEPVKATESETLQQILNEGVEAQTLLGHIRLATVGTIEYANCHPFSEADNYGRVWTLVHNGTIFSGAALNGYLGVQFGETDSERVLLHFIARVNRQQIRLGRPLDEKERFDVLASAIAALAKGNKLNLLIFDGEVMYAHTNYKGALHFLKDEDSIAFSTQPLSDGEWHPVPFTCLVATKDGSVIRESAPHGNEYIHNPEDYQMVYMNYSRL